MLHVQPMDSKDITHKSMEDIRYNNSEEEDKAGQEETEVYLYRFYNCLLTSSGLLFTHCNGIELMQTRLR